MAITHSVREGIAEVVMNNPPVNALDVAGWFKLAETVRDVMLRRAVVRNKTDIQKNAITPSDLTALADDSGGPPGEPTGDGDSTS